MQHQVIDTAPECNRKGHCLEDLGQMQLRAYIESFDLKCALRELTHAPGAEPGYTVSESTCRDYNKQTNYCLPENRLRTLHGREIQNLRKE